MNEPTQVPATSRRRRRVPIVLSQILALILLVAAVGCGGDDGGASSASPGDQTSPDASEPPAELEPLRIGLGGSVNNGSFFHTLIAADAGIFEEHGFEPELIPIESPQIAAALEAGDIDVTPSPQVKAVIAGAPIRSVAVTLGGYDFVILARGITEAAELSGKTIVTAAPTSAPGVAVTAAIEEFGLTDVDVVNAGSTQNRISLLLSNQADASLLHASEALNLQREESDLHVVVNADEFGPNLFVGVTTLEKTIEEQPDKIQRVVDVYLDAARFFVDEPEESKRILAERLELTQEDSEVLYDMMVPLNLVDGLPTDELWEGEAYLTSLTLDREVSVDEIKAAYDLRFIES